MPREEEVAVAVEDKGRLSYRKNGVVASECRRKMMMRRTWRQSSRDRVEGAVSIRGERGATREWRQMPELEL